MRRRLAIALVAWLAVLTVGGCSVGPRPSQAATAVVASQSGPPARGSVWSRLLASVGQSGGVSQQAALVGISLLVGPGPGMAEPGGPAGFLADASVAAQWAISHWPTLPVGAKEALLSRLASPAQRVPPLLGAQSAASGRRRSYAEPAELAGFASDAMRAWGSFASHLQTSPGQDLRVVAAPGKARHPVLGAFSVSLDSNWRFSGPAAHCVIFVAPASLAGRPAAVVDSMADHAVFHCFEAAYFPSVSAFASAPTWVVAGASEWAGDVLDPLPDPWWVPYLSDPSESLMRRTYDALGFFAELSASGINPWKALPSMLEAGSGPAAFEAVTSPNFDSEWASSLVRLPFGPAWEASGPGLVDVSARPQIHLLAEGSLLEGTVPAFTNLVVPLDVASGLLEVELSAPDGRLHAADGGQYGGSSLQRETFCISPSCSSCPDLSSLTRIPAGPVWLAISGGSEGTRYRISGSVAACEACPVGAWVSQSISIPVGPSEVLQGGAGVEVDVGPAGTMSFNYSEMSPLSSGGVSVVLSGTQSGLLSLPPSIGVTQGTFIAPSDALPALSVPSSKGLVGTQPPGTVAPFPFTSSMQWSCSGSSMSFSPASSALPAGQGSRWTLQRLP